MPYSLSISELASRPDSYRAISMDDSGGSQGLKNADFSVRRHQ